MSPDGGPTGDAFDKPSDSASDAPSDGSTPATDAQGDAVVLLPCEDGGVAGALDPSFGDGGVVYVNASPGQPSHVDAIVDQPDGKTVLAGSLNGTSAGPRRFGLVRLSAAGALDTGFGDGGIVDTPFSVGTGGEVSAVALATDGRILAAGAVYLGTNINDFAIARYSPSGALDGTFGDGGVVFTGFVPEQGAVASIAVLPDARIVVAGSRGSPLTPPPPDSPDYVVAKFHATGAPDTTFGVGGKVRIDVRGTGDGPGVMVVQPDGKLLIAGCSARPAPKIGIDLSAVRLDANGSLDATFGTDGKVTLGLVAESCATATALDGTGRIVLAGRTGTTTPSSSVDFAVFRLSPTGALDPTFASGGVATADFAGNYDEVRGGGLYIQPDGKLVAVGTSSDLTGNVSHAMARFQLDGAPDLGFGAAGGVFLPKPTRFFFRVAALSRDRVTLGGYVSPPGGEPRMAVTRHCR